MFDKVRANQTNCNQTGIYTTWVFIERQDAFKEKKVMWHNCDFRDFFFPQQFVLWLIFQPRWKCNCGSFLRFKHCNLFTAWLFFEFVVRNCKIFVQLSALFRKISPPLKHFATLKSRIILIFKFCFSNNFSIPTTFRLKVPEKPLWLSWNSLPWTFSSTYFKSIS